MIFVDFTAPVTASPTPVVLMAWRGFPLVPSLVFAVVNLDETNPVTIVLDTCEDGTHADKESSMDTVSPLSQTSFEIDNTRTYYRLSAYTANGSAQIKFRVRAP